MWLPQLASVFVVSSLAVLELLHSWIRLFAVALLMPMLYTPSSVMISPFARSGDNSYRLTTEIDIDAHPNISMYDFFRYVKIVDTGNNG